VCKNGLKELAEEQKQRRSQFAKTFWRGKMTFWAVSSQVMKHGSTNTTLKRSGKVPNGRLPIPHDQKISISPNQESKEMLLTFFDIRGIVHLNLYQLDKQSTKFTIWKYWKGCVKKTEMTQTFCQQLMDLASRQCEGVFSY